MPEPPLTTVPEGLLPRSHAGREEVVLRELIVDRPDVHDNGQRDGEGSPTADAVEDGRSLHRSLVRRRERELRTLVGMLVAQTRAHGHDDEQDDAREQDGAPEPATTISPCQLCAPAAPK